MIRIKLLRWYRDVLLKLIYYGSYKYWTNNSYVTKFNLNSSFKLDFPLPVLYFPYLKLAPPPYQKERSFSIKHPLTCFISLQNCNFDTVRVSIFFCERLKQLKLSVGILLYPSTGELPIFGPFSIGKKIRDWENFYICYQEKIIIALFFPYISPLYFFKY